MTEDRRLTSQGLERKEQLLACAGEASAALGYRGATEAPATPTIRRRQP